MTTIFLIRHAQCEGNLKKVLSGRTDFKLTEEGKMTANNLVEKFKKFKIDKIYSSPSIRCIDTIRPTAKWLNLDINICNDLIEKDFGVYDGMTWEEIKKQNPQVVIDKDKFNEIRGIEGQETSSQVRKRIKESIQNIAEKEDGYNIIICSHGCTIELFLRDINHIKQTEQREKYGQKNAQINLIEYQNNKFEIIKINM